MSIEVTLKKFPISGQLKDECGLPFACVVQPFSRIVEASLERPCEVKAADVARCETCFSYINKFCQIQIGGWACSMCNGYNEFTTPSHRKYTTSKARQVLPELRRSIVEVECDPNEGLKFEDDGDEEDGEEEVKGPVYGTPMYVALVDVCGGDDYLELVKSALQAALEAIPSGSLFGLITFSNQIGLYETAGPIPVVRYVPIMESEGAPTPLELEDALPLSALLTPVSQHKEAIAAALDALQAEPFQPSPDGVPEALEGHCGFGSAVQAVLRYLGGAAASPQLGARQDSTAEASISGAAPNGKQGLSGSTYAGGRLLTFLGGPPNFGRGPVFRKYQKPSAAAAEPYASEIMLDPMMADLNPYTYSMPAVAAQTQVAQDQVVMAGADGQLKVVINEDSCEFYEEAAAAAASLAICIDLYIVSAVAVGLCCLEPLAVSSGGVVYLYPNLEEAALPQDLYRRLTAAQALGGLLRLRTSPDFRVARAYGHLYPDDQFENLYHVISCDPQDAFVFDFEYTSSSGFDAHGDAPALQLVFQYSVLLPTTASLGPEADALLQPSQRRFTHQRRMRIQTMPMPVAGNPRQVYEGVNPDAVLAVLLHKIVAAAAAAGAAEGAREGHALLQDWLVALAEQYNGHVLGAEGGIGLTPDVTFEAVEALQPMSRLVYGLLRSPVLSQASSQHPDLHTALRLLWTALPAAELRRAVYPLLSSYTTPDEQAYPLHSLSEAALATSGAPIFLLDSFTQVMVYYLAGYPKDLAFPPPQQSALRLAVNKLRADRRLTPQLRMLRGGVDDEAPFHECLIEEPDAGLAAAGAAAGQGFALFLESVRAEVARGLQSGE